MNQAITATDAGAIPDAPPAARPAPVWSRRVGVLLLVLATLGVLWWHGHAVQFFCDDAYISYRYSENFAAGHGLVYNIGERVEGYTNFLWVILIGLGMKAGLRAEPLSLWLGVTFLLVTLAATATLARRLLRSHPFALVPCFLLVCQGPMILWSMSGLEASLYAAITLLAIVAYERWFLSAKGLLLAGALYGLSTMVRPDGVVFGGAAGLHLLACGLLARPLALRRLVARALALAAGFVVAFGPFVLWRHSYYDDWLPNTFYVKAGGVLNLRLGFGYLATWFGEYPLAGWLTLVGIAATLTLPRFREQRRTYAHLALALTLFSGYLAWAGGDYMALYRFLVPLLPLAMIPATALLHALFEQARRVRMPAMVTGGVGLALLAGAGVALTRPTIESVENERSKSVSLSTVKRMKRNTAQWVALGKALGELKQKLPADFTIATTAAGAIPYFAQMRTIDQSGLCDRHTAKEESDPWLLDRPGHMKQATRAYLASRKPEIICWHPQIWDAGKPAREFPVAPTPDYELRAMALPGLTEKEGKVAYVWVRKEVGATLQPLGIIPAKESVRWAKATAAAPTATNGEGVEKTNRKEKRDEEIAKELAALDQAPPEPPPTIDPPLPTAYSGAIFSTERLHAADPKSEEPRFSIDNISRPLWHDDSGSTIEISGVVGTYVELDIASIPLFEVTEDPQTKKKTTKVIRAPGIVAPKSALLTLVTSSGRRELPTTLVSPAADGVAAWRRVRGELAGAPASAASLELSIDGQPAREKKSATESTPTKWLTSVPRIHQQVESGDRFNVLIITVDTLRADYLGCYGHDRPTSPYLDALSKAAVVCERNLSQASWTLPSYSSFFSGQYVEAHGVVHRDHKFLGVFETFIERFAAAGYETGGIASGTFTDAFWGFDQGFDAYDDLGMVVDESNLAASVAANGMAPMNPQAMETGAHRRITSPEVANKAIQFLDDHRDRRFLLFAHFFDPHEDYVKHPGVSEFFTDRPPPRGFPNAVDRKPEISARRRSLYEGEIAYTDFHIGRVLRRLSALGLAERTIVVVFADHGEAFKEHILKTKVEEDDKNYGHGSSLFNEQVRVPLIVHVPGIAPGRVATPTGNLDIGPTLLELCNVDASDWIHHGVSLVDLLRNKGGDAERNVFAAQFIALPLEGAAAEERVQVAHRVDRDELSAIGYEPMGGKAGQQFLFSWRDRWQDYAKNLLQTMHDKFDELDRYYAQRRSDLQKLPPPASRLDTSGHAEKLKQLGYPQGDQGK